MEDLRSAFTVISFATFIGIVWWAWRPAYKAQAERAMNDALMDDDRDSRVAANLRGEQK
ncbi:MAG: cbb3-type cytochrome c oxidase subunit 3 [Burkholderiales bacterium]|nr:cbb3-type cytochrome c oxidase subunit 3 [Burkholderiales bacterium]